MLEAAQAQRHIANMRPAGGACDGGALRCPSRRLVVQLRAGIKLLLLPIGAPAKGRDGGPGKRAAQGGPEAARAEFGAPQRVTQRAQ